MKCQTKVLYTTFHKINGCIQNFDVSKDKVLLEE